MITWDDLQKRGCPRCKKPFGKIERDLRSDNEKALRAHCNDGHCFAAIFEDTKLIALEWYLSTENAVIYLTRSKRWRSISDGHLDGLFKPFKSKMALEELYDGEDDAAYTDGVLDRMFAKEKKLCGQCRKEHQ